ncbi:hypothetical protein BFC17_20375 [Alteromonas lipolytica]|uniref:Uncharacterized protein n=2 Tax=Alteromonas lipolytica TaxID=1856405 RepID=A0A1E8FEL1_9ALTE|nr:hypothetical protein BFC17_20375 [Alteromonas lipolytica]
MNWQQAFRVIKNNSIRCYQGNAGIIGTGATTTVNANLYNELGEAEIQINGNLGTFLLFEIIKLDEGAKIVGYSAMSTWTKELYYLKPVKSKDGEQFIFDC